MQENLLSPGPQKLLLASLLFANLQCVAAAPLIELVPKRVFDIPAYQGLRLVDFDSNNSGLYFLFSGRGLPSVVLHTGIHGEALKVVPVEGSECIRVAESGELALLRRKREGATFFIHDKTGSNAGQVASGEYISDYAFLGTSIIAATAQQIVELPLKTQRSDWVPLPMATPPPLRLGLLPGGRVITVSLMSATLQLSGPGSFVLGPLALEAPEIQAVLGPRNSAMVRTIATSSAGRFYLNATGQVLRLGAAVLEFEPNGMLRRRFRCVLPPARSAPAETSYPNCLGISGSELVIVDSQELRVMCYQLPR